MTATKIIDTLRINFSRADVYANELSSYVLENEVFSDISKVKTIDGFIYRFAKIQDMMGERLFPIYLESLQEYKNSMSFIDMLNKLEKLEMIKSADEWKYFRMLRNLLTHEYPDNEDEIIEGIKEALTVYKKMEAIFDAIVGELK
jgi:hypothetical protein